MSARGPMTVLIADHSTVVRRRLCALVAETAELALVGEAAFAVEASLLVEARRPDAVVLDLEMPDGSSFAVAQQVKRTAPECLVIMLTDALEPEYSAACRRAGADFLFHKSREFENVIEFLVRAARQRDQVASAVNGERAPDSPARMPPNDAPRAP